MVIAYKYFSELYEAITMHCIMKSAINLAVLPAGHLIGLADASGDLPILV
jgi:hypothetical protein